MNTLIQLWPVALGLVTGSFIARVMSNFRQNRARRKRAKAHDAAKAEYQSERERQKRVKELVKETIQDRGDF